MLSLAKKHIDKDTLFVLDPSDLSKKYAEKMEHLCQVRDGSQGVVADGYPLMHVIGCRLDSNEIVPLPPPYDGAEGTPEWKPLTDAAKEQYEATLDDTIAVSIPRPKTKEEEEALVKKFLSGLEKLFSKEDNWTFLQPLVLSMENCAKCQTCSEACHIDGRRR